MIADLYPKFAISYIHYIRLCHENFKLCYIGVGTLFLPCKLLKWKLKKINFLQFSLFFKAREFVEKMNADVTVHMKSRRFVMQLSLWHKSQSMTVINMVHA